MKSKMALVLSDLEREVKGDLLAAFCSAKDVTIMNSLEQPNRRYTWVSPEERHRNQPNPLHSGHNVEHYFL